ncbi:hypothetical protein H4R24_002782 [Coemansia sp. RSA 988]|nr:hypothetical protein H4R24_002782 [Coemansia sp. RSA 988]
MQPLYKRHESRAFERAMYVKHIGMIVPMFKLFLNGKGVDDIDTRDVREALDKLTYQKSIQDACGDPLELYIYNVRFVNNEDRSEVKFILLASISETDIVVETTSDAPYIYSSKGAVTHMFRGSKVAYVDGYTSEPTNIIVGPLPYPENITETEVLIEVHAAALNPIDYKRAEGMISLMYPEKFPLKLGYDVAGVVAKVGTKVERFKEGDKVYGRLSCNHVGSIGEVVVAEELDLAPIPESVPFTVAAAVPLAGLTAKQALEWVGLERGQSLFVNGGMGGVGMFAVALGKHYFGAEVTTTVSSGKIERVKQMGASKVVDYTKESYTEVLEDTADVVFDTVGDAEIYRVAKHNSSAVSIAMLPDGNGLELFRHESAPLSLFGKAKLTAAKLIVTAVGWYLTRGFRSKNIRYGYVVMAPDGHELEKTFNPLLENGTIKPAIANVYPFTTDGVQSAFKELMAGHVAGKIIICVKD